MVGLIARPPFSGPTAAAYPDIATLAPEATTRVLKGLEPKRRVSLFLKAEHWHSIHQHRTGKVETQMAPHSTAKPVAAIVMPSLGRWGISHPPAMAHDQMMQPRNTMTTCASRSDRSRWQRT